MNKNTIDSTSICSIANLWNKLLRLPLGEHVTRDEAQLIGAHLAERLGKSLASTVALDWSTLGVDEGNIDVVVRSQEVTSGLLSIGWQARLSVTLLGDDTISIDAMVFLFCNNNRIIAPKIGDYLHFEFAPASKPDGEWILRGWTRDEFDEWRDLEQFD